MRKNILSATFVVAMIAVAGYNVYVNQTKTNMSELAFANIEALAVPEGEIVQTCGTHYESINDKSKCEGDNSYSEGMVGIEHSKTTGTESKYCKGFSGFIYVCTSPTGTYRDDVKEYECGEDEFSNIFGF